jgi:hypothetical protein
METCGHFRLTNGACNYYYYDDEYDDKHNDDDEVLCGPSRKHTSNMDLDFTVRGKRMTASSEEVIQKLRSITPGPIRKHAVKVQGVNYPVKQAFSAVTGVDVLDFDTTEARRWFQRLGFEVVRVDEPARAKKGRRAAH